MNGILTEENGIYSIDCTKAVWATDRIHEDYHEAGVHLKDVDFLIENESSILMVEYKNACVEDAANPEAFNPASDRKISTVTGKFYDSLHYLNLLGKNKPVQYIYVLEYPNGDVTTRKRLRNRIKTELPFVLQENIGNGRKLIDKIDVVSIQEWNENEGFGEYPIRKLPGNRSDDK